MMTDADFPSATARPLADCTAFQIDILLAMADGGPQKGVRIGERLEPRHGEVRPGRLYPNLDTLRTRRLVSKTPINDRANEYALNDVGRAAVRAYADYVQACVDGQGGEA